MTKGRHKALLGVVQGGDQASPIVRFHSTSLADVRMWLRRAGLEVDTKSISWVGNGRAGLIEWHQGEWHGAYWEMPE